MSRWKSATLALVLANVLVFIGMFIDKTNYYIERYGFNYTAFSSGDTPKISLLASNFMHVSAEHLFSNVILLALFGVFLERKIGRLRLVISYFVTGMGGTFVQGYFIHTRVFGASAAAFGFIGMFVALYISDYKRIDLSCLKSSVLSLYPHYLFVVSLLSLAVLLHRVFTSPDIRIGDVAHYWGFAIGVIIGIFMKGRRGG